MRLILFSGGVESTALCTLANEGDILLVSDRVNSTEGGIWHESSAHAIANYFNLEIQRFTMSGPKGNRWAHQWHHLFSVAHIVVSRNSGFTEVWYGANSDFSSQQQQILETSVRQQHQRAWQILHPDVALRCPLEQLSKRQQWNLIPDAAKSMVVTCTQIFHYTDKHASTPTVSFENHVIKGCGRCEKCREFEKFVILAS